MRAAAKLAILLALTGCVAASRPTRPAGPDVMPPEDCSTKRREPSRACAAAADEILRLPGARGRDELPAPHRDRAPLPAVQTPGDLRALVGRRDKRDPLEAALGWGRALTRKYPEVDSGADLVAWAEHEHRRYPPEMTIAAGDLLVFERVDLVAIAIGRDGRGVVEFAYVLGGVVRRGFTDPKRPRLRRDGDGVVVNTYLRHGKRQPPKGTRYLAGELIAHVIR